MNTKEKIEHGELLKILRYEKETGEFFSLVSRGDRKVGDRCGYISGGRYRILRINKKNYLEHRLAWFYVYGYWPKQQIDHMNGIKTDNRISNLREVTARENAQNIRAPSHRNKSRFISMAWGAKHSRPKPSK